MVVDGAPYDEMITSFEYEPGYHYILEANQVWRRPLRVVGDHFEDRSGRHGRGDQPWMPTGSSAATDIPGYCKVVNGAPFRGEIVGFQPWHDYSYRLRVERFDMFPDGKAGSPEVPAHGYRWLETLESKAVD